LVFAYQVGDPCYNFPPGQPAGCFLASLPFGPIAQLAELRTFNP
jgi:hypothetical protein